MTSSGDSFPSISTILSNEIVLKSLVISTITRLAIDRNKTSLISVFHFFSQLKNIYRPHWRKIMFLMHTCFAAIPVPDGIPWQKPLPEHCCVNSQLRITMPAGTANHVYRLLLLTTRISVSLHTKSSTSVLMRSANSSTMTFRSNRIAANIKYILFRMHTV